MLFGQQKLLESTLLPTLVCSSDMIFTLERNATVE